MDWAEWHRAYEDPASRLSQRLAMVQGQLREALDRAPAGPLSVISICGGQGRDLHCRVEAAEPFEAGSRMFTLVGGATLRAARPGPAPG